MVNAEFPTRLPSVSVVMPCYNASRYIAAAIRSVLDQEYPGPLDILVVDDGSTDDSVRIASGFKHVTVLRQTNMGPAAARNLALGHSHAEFIAFLDADDLWIPGSLRPRVECLVQNPDVAVVFGDFTRWTPAAAATDSDTESPDRLPESVSDAVASGWLFPEILLDPIVHIITIVARREVFASVGDFDRNLRTGEDYEFWIRVARRFRFRKLDRFIARYRVHPGGTTRVPRVQNNEYIVTSRAVAAFGLTGQRGVPLDMRLLHRRMHQICFNHAYLHYWHGDPRVAATGFCLAIRHGPRQPKAWIYALLSVCKACLLWSPATTKSTK
ncbi:MAG TPA: glycosyltransferase [Burkholderiaceae bacterium]